MSSPFFELEQVGAITTLPTVIAKDMGFSVDQT